ncbi:Ribosomal protein S12p Asp88 (E. coli) methylthiotransferase [hydrothermal vent metagenome]|uniref:Ribosomal protein S12p Asp88 (E. coli) methylthiotransferase n=1 Tax=hydrothermal vent metagenome TaxID=652676 RepID=A0A1W1ELE0_9ZZZZ
MSKKLHLISLGCTKNLVDSEVMLGRLRDYEVNDDASIADVIIINTCGFIDSAKEESINTILDTHNIRKDGSILVVSGCLSERYREELQKELPEVDIFTGVGDYEKIDELIAKKENRFSDSVYLADENSNRIITGSSSHAYIKISEGCNQVCSFCAIPSFKGKLHSRSLDSIKKEVQRLVDNGYYEFSFVSQDSSSYGRDMGLDDGLIDLIEMVEGIDGVKSAKILYLYPSTTTMALIDKIANSNTFETYYDMPIQHIANSMLLKMKRGFGEEQTIELLKRMKSHKDSMIRSAIIAGHPNETNEEFERVCEFVKEFEFDRLSIFEYSNEESTKAHTMEQIDEEIISQRANILGDIASMTNIKSLENMIGKDVEVVLNGESDEHEYILSARPLNWAFEIDGDILINDTNELEIRYGDVYRAKITDIAGDRLLASLI